MPTILRPGPYRIFFYSGDRDEPPHVHVERDDCETKFWLTPVKLEKSSGFRPQELRKIQSMVEEKAEELLGSWNEYFES